MTTVAWLAIARSAVASSFLVVGVGLTSPAAWAADKAWSDCTNSNVEISIAGCTKVLGRGAAETAENQAIAHHNRGLAFLSKGDGDRAIADLDRAIELKPDYSDAYLSRGFIYGSKGAYDKEIADESKAIEINPKAAIAYQDRGWAFGRKGDDDREIEDESKAIGIDPKNAFAHLVRGEGHWGKGKYDSAIADLSTAIELDPKLAIAYADRSGIHFKRAEFDQVIADATKAIDLDPQMAIAYVRRSAGYFYERNYGASADDASKAIGLNPPEDLSGIAYIDRGWALAKEGESDRALADFNKVIEANRNGRALAGAYSGRGFLDTKKGDYDQALADLDKAIEFWGDAQEYLVGYTFDTRGDVYAAKGEPDKAVADYRRAASLVAENDEEHGQLLARIAELEKQIAPRQSGSRLALVIGNSDYAAVGKLANPGRDAAAIAAALRDDGFEVTNADNVNRADFLAAINRFADTAASADLAVVYFAGHGLQLDGVNYLVPVDAKLAADRDVEDEAIPLERVISAVRGVRKLGLIIVDACRNNPFLASMRLTTATRGAGTRGLARVTAHGTTLVEFSAQEGQEALDGDDPAGDSPFAAALAKRLAASGLEIGKLLRQVREDVLAATNDRQEPMFSGNLPAEDVFFRVQ
jgi:tetratricopeptide (TPR) repeat protein